MFCCLYCLPLLSQQLHTNKQLDAAKIVNDVEFIIDGYLDESFWQYAESIDQFHQVRPNEFKKPTEKTEVKVTYNNDYLLVSAKLYESDPNLIESNQLIQGKDYPFDDRFYLILDTLDNQKSGYFFQLNPNGIRTEGLLDEKILHDDWSTIWQGKARLDEAGWVIEMAIPFKSLNFPKDSKNWGINFGRVIARNNEVISWSSGGSDNWELAPSVTGSINGITDIQQGLGLDIKVSSSVTQSNGKEVDSGFEPSLDFLYKPNSSLNVALTLNTDFSATEADLRVLNNSRFSIFLPEKRDFFLQDVDIFEFGDIEENGKPFFSRTIGLNESGEAINLNFGSKVTGRTQRLNYGFLAVEQQDKNNPAQKLYVGRLTTNISSNSKVGLIATQGDPLSGAPNRLMGVDYKYQNNDVFNQKSIDGGLWYQRTDQSDVNNTNNQAYGASLSYPNDDMSFYFTTTKIEESFNPSLGFVNRSGIHESILQGGFQYRFKSDWLLNYYPWLYLRYVNNDQNSLLDKELEIYPLAFRSVQGDYVEMAHKVKTEVLDQPFQLFSEIEVDAGKYNYNSSHIYFSSAKTRVLSVDLFYQTGGFYNGYLNQQKHSINWRPNKNLFFSAEYSANDISLPNDAIKTKLFNLSHEIAFNSNWSWLSVIQYDNLSDSIGSSSRVQWKPNAFSELHLTFNSTQFKTNLNMSQSDQKIIAVKYSRTFRF